MNKILNYKVSNLMSFVVILLSFFMLLLVSTNKMNSYAIEDNSTDILTDSFDLLISSTIKSKSLLGNGDLVDGISVKKVFNDSNLVFSLNSDDNYGYKYFSKKSIDDYGLLYIINNSYPNINISDSNGNSLNGDISTWITQVSIWLYLYEKDMIDIGYSDVLSNSEVDLIKNTNLIFIDDNISFKSKDIYNNYIKGLVSNALIYNKNHDRNLNVNLESKKIYVTKDNKYYQSSIINVTFSPADYFKKYSVSLENAPSGSVIVSEEGRIISDTDSLDVSDKFYVRVPKNSINSDTDISIKVVGIYDDIEGKYYESTNYNSMIGFRKYENYVNSKLNVTFYKK